MNFDVFFSSFSTPGIIFNQLKFILLQTFKHASFLSNFVHKPMFFFVSEHPHPLKGSQALMGPVPFLATFCHCSTVLSNTKA
jgi:hypothetical protein